MKPAAYKKLLAQATRLEREAQRLLKLVVIHSPVKRLPIVRIMEVVAADLEVPLAVMTSPLRGLEAEAFARHLAMFFTHELLDFSLAEIGRQFGGRDHGTVLNAIRAVRARVETESTRAVQVKALRAFFLKELNR